MRSFSSVQRIVAARDPEPGIGRGCRTAASATGSDAACRHGRNSPDGGSGSASEVEIASWMISPSASSWPPIVASHSDCPACTTQPPRSMRRSGTTDSIPRRCMSSPLAPSHSASSGFMRMFRRTFDGALYRAVCSARSRICGFQRDKGSGDLAGQLDGQIRRRLRSFVQPFFQVRRQAGGELVDPAFQPGFVFGAARRPVPRPAASSGPLRARRTPGPRPVPPGRRSSSARPASGGPSGWYGSANRDSL